MRWGWSWNQITLETRSHTCIFHNIHYHRPRHKLMRVSFRTIKILTKGLHWCMGFCRSSTISGWSFVANVINLNVLLKIMTRNDILAGSKCLQLASSTNEKAITIVETSIIENSRLKLFHCTCTASQHLHDKWLAFFIFSF